MNSKLFASSTSYGDKPLNGLPHKGLTVLAHHGVKLSGSVDSVKA